MDRKVIQQDRCFNARCHAMQSFRPCTYVCNTFEHVGGNMLEYFGFLGSTRGLRGLVFLEDPGGPEDPGGMSMKFKKFLICKGQQVQQPNIST